MNGIDVVAPVKEIIITILAKHNIPVDLVNVVFKNTIQEINHQTVVSRNE